MPRRPHSGAMIFSAAAIVSVLAHAFAISLLLASRSADLGSVDVATNAISVNLETTDVLDAAENAASRAAASSPAGTPVEGAKETVEEGQQKEERKDSPANEVALTDIREQDAAQTEKAEKEQREKAQQATAPGGEGVIGADEAQASAGRVSASQGAILNYGARLRAMISSNTPRNIRKTSVHLAFSLAPSGGLTGASILSSSGDPRVDNRMLDLIRELAPRFPKPPDGATASQLTYNIEIIFR